jgi:predicted AAA+ superfamily ATPase
MYSRMLTFPTSSFFLFGPRGTGKTALLRERLGDDALFFDLLDSHTYTRLLAHPESLADLIPRDQPQWIVVDEIQRVPELLNEVHRLIESRKLKFALTGSSARKLRQKGVNLLAGRAITKRLHPLTSWELGNDFDLPKAIQYGGLPMACTSEQPAEFLASYVSTYLREEVQQEGLVRSLGAFTRFLEAASFSQGSVLNMAGVARECSVDAKVVQNYFSILEDLLLAQTLPAFTKRAKRRLVAHPKFYFFDPGVFQTLRPRGPLDPQEQIDGPAMETLVFYHLQALNDYRNFGYRLHYWRTQTGDEVDFVLYGQRGLIAIEVKRGSRPTKSDLSGLRKFQADFPEARLYLFHGGTRHWHENGIEILPLPQALPDLPQLL